jgi:Spore Coat Protein U domain
MSPSIPRWLLRLLLACIACIAGQAHAAYSCNVTPTSLGVIYRQGGGNRVDQTGTVTLTCTRNVATDASTLTYRIGVDNGDNFAGGARRTRLGATGNYLTYTITRAAAVGATAACADASNWDANPAGANLMTGTLNFGTSASATVNWSFCVRVRGNQGNAAAGQYVDTPNVGVQYPATAAGAIAFSSFTYTIGARNQCVLNSYPGDMVFNYSSFQAGAQAVNQVFRIACSNNLPWSVAIAPATGTLLGLNYTLTRAPAAGTGNGNPQNITITGTMAAGQRGTCATSTCSASQPHTMTITY